MLITFAFPDELLSVAGSVSMHEKMLDKVRFIDCKIVPYM